ncbi:MAG TPA: glycosyltransferase [Chthoniobacteraceae bacterium]
MPHRIRKEHGEHCRGTSSALKPRDMRRVLIPSDNRDFVPQLAAAYRRQGWEVAVGALNFDLQVGSYDVVHFQWPEELTSWEPPTSARIAEIASTLDAWAGKSRLLLTVHNLYPHRHHGDPRCREFLEVFYERMEVLAHFTEASSVQVAGEFPITATRRNVVTGFFNFDSLLPAGAREDPGEARRRLGIAEDEFVVLSFGALRDWAEVELVRKGFDGARLPGKRLLMAGRYQEFGPVWRQRWRRWSWNRWLKRVNAVTKAGFVPDAEVSGLVEASDVLMVPRLDVLNSGLPALAATFGKIFVVPDCGGLPEIASGTDNPVYRSGDAASLAAALEQASRLDRKAMAQRNRQLADSWSWDQIVRVGLDALGFS